MKNWIFPSLAGLAGFSIFLAFGGLHTLNVNNISYLLFDDPAQHWIGWEFFRHTPWLQWPIGNNNAYGTHLNNSIVYTDSIPIFALFFKVFSPLLPVKFQYTGIWMAICCVMQGVMGFLLIRKFTRNDIYSLIGSLFFILSSPLIFRLTGHFALSAHWLILAGIILYFDSKAKGKYWALILIFSSLVHAYILAMLLAIWIANLLNRYVKKQITLKYIIITMLITCLCLFMVMYSIGYFNVSDGLKMYGFGFYKLNLNAPINPLLDSYSSIIKPLPVEGGDYEGINYFGFGIISLMLISFISAPFSKYKIKNCYKNNIIFIILCISLYIYALSSNITIGSIQLLQLNYPHQLEGLTSTFRASGRFFWTVFYASIAFGIIFAYRIFEKKKATAILIVCALIQIHDSKNIFPYMKNKFQAEITIDTPKDDRWIELSKSKKNLVGIPAQEFNPDWKKWAYFASINDMNINFGYFARYNKESWEKQSKEELDSAQKGELNTNSIYIFKNKELFEDVLSKYNGESVNFHEDNIYIIAPK
ncbi:DUF6311 domain-containing protein [Citrobacter europaeus]|uniref:DUF6311 domain-containing protein n=1 Tax=Citrobacter europaeus TaxID=1914243 RepID=UPI0039C13EEF